MSKAIALALAAALCTAVSSICQRRGALRIARSDRLRANLILQLIREPIWLLGMVSMIAGFGCQAAALHFGGLALVQPILATELLFVFGFIAVASPYQVRPSDWMAAGAMAAGLGLFLFAADPSGGRTDASAYMWMLTAVSAFGLVVLVAASAQAPMRRGTRPSPSRRAALLGVATGISWGFLAAVIKELGGPAEHGMIGLLTSWPLYVLVGVGAASMILSTNALHAGPLAASQPGFTIVDPLVASLVGIFVFRERLNLRPVDLAIEVAALAVLVFGVIALSHSGLVHGETSGTASDDTSAEAPSGEAEPSYPAH